LGGACLSLKISLPGLQTAASDSCRGLLSLLNRSRSKPAFLGKLQEALVMVPPVLTLIEASRIFMRMNTIYKQASFERHQNKKKPKGEGGPPSTDAQTFQLLENSLLQGKSIEVLFLQQIRLGRLRANTGHASTNFYNVLVEFAPNNRVLSGELIVF
jgi:hypothetical protein